MNWKEFIIKLSHEGRDWAKVLIPAFLAGLHLPQPSWIKKKTDTKG